MTHRTRISAGNYRLICDTPQGEVTFNIVRREDGRWYWVNENDTTEGGDDLFPSMRRARTALTEYCAHRKFVVPYGYCYVP